MHRDREALARRVFLQALEDRGAHAGIARRGREEDVHHAELTFLPVEIEPPDGFARALDHEEARALVVLSVVAVLERELRIAERALRRFIPTRDGELGFAR